MKKKWTPGPWSTQYFDNVRSTVNNEFIAFGIGQIKYGRTDEERILLAEANARLIAAAPELYEALEEAERALRATMVIPLADKYAAVLAKARGESVR